MRSRSRGAMRPSFARRPSRKMRAQATLRERTLGEPGVRCTRSLVCKVENTRVSHHRFTGPIRLSPRNGFNGLLRALLSDRALLPLSPARRGTRLRKLDAGVEASGPHDLAVRNEYASSRAPPRPPHLTATFVTIATRPSSAVRRAELKRRFGSDVKQNIFARRARQALADLPGGQDRCGAGPDHR
jgi:hypothetical protein